MKIKKSKSSKVICRNSEIEFKEILYSRILVHIGLLKKRILYI